MKLKAIYLDVNANAPKLIEVEDELSEYYRLIDCDTVNIVDRFITGYHVCVICDDMGLYKNDVKTSGLFYPKIRQAFVGNLILTGPGDLEGNLTSLTDDQTEDILRAYVKVNDHPCLLFEE